MTQGGLPGHYRGWIRRLVRTAAVFWFVGLLLGVWSVELSAKLRYGGEARVLSAEERAEGRAVVEVPAGFFWEVGRDMRISHGHTILIGGVLPLCVGAALVMLHAAGARPVAGRTLGWFYGTYLSGAVVALGLMIYKGHASYRAVLGGEFDLGAVHAGLFGGSRLVRGLAYGLSHTVMAVGVGVIVVALWRAAGTVGEEDV